jgi:hypothetical protein
MMILMLGHVICGVGVLVQKDDIDKPGEPEGEPGFFL